MAKSDVDFAQYELENAHICIVFPGHLSFLPACAAILDFKNVTPLGPSRRSIPPISMLGTINVGDTQRGTPTFSDTDSMDTDHDIGDLII